MTTPTSGGEVDYYLRQLRDWKVSAEIGEMTHVGMTTYARLCGWTLARAGRFDESYKHFSKTVGPAQAHYNVARMMEHLGKPELSKRHLRAALKANPSFDEAVAWLKKAPFDGGTEIELRPVFETADFGAEMTPELREQEDRLRATVEARKA